MIARYEHSSLFGLVVSNEGKKFCNIDTWAQCCKLFTVVIYRHSMVILSSCVIKQHYLGNYCRMAVNYIKNIYNIEFTLE